MLTFKVTIHIFSEMIGEILDTLKELKLYEHRRADSVDILCLNDVSAIHKNKIQQHDLIKNTFSRGFPCHSVGGF